MRSRDALEGTRTTVLELDAISFVRLFPVTFVCCYITLGEVAPIPEDNEEYSLASTLDMQIIEMVTQTLPSHYSRGLIWINRWSTYLDMWLSLIN